MKHHVEDHFNILDGIVNDNVLQFLEDFTFFFISFIVLMLR